MITDLNSPSISPSHGVFAAGIPHSNDWADGAGCGRDETRTGHRGRLLSMAVACEVPGSLGLLPGLGEHLTGIPHGLHHLRHADIRNEMAEKLDDIVR